ncbi:MULTISPECIES: hypothetical protein [unclassified Microbacterium]|uniref:hypothetical protein n=1 Tax=unclassified Microbacterium TaxID=2609290 RepID=UPI0030184685
MASEDNLASSTDVSALLGRDLTSAEAAQVEALLTQASALFRMASRRSFTAGESLVRLKVNGGEVRLPETPVVNVSAVTDDDGNPVPFTQFQGTLTVPLLSHRFVRVAYTHGSDAVPELVVSTVAGMVARVMSIDPKAKSGVVQHQTTATPYSENDTYASWAIGGQVMLSPADMDVAKNMRPTRLSNTVVLGSS